MKIGIGRAQLRFPEGFFPTEGFVSQAHPLFVRTLFLDADNPFALVSIEMTSLTDEECIRIKGECAQVLGIPEGCIWVAATHTFSAPHILPDMALRTEEDRTHRTQLRTLLTNAVREATADARHSAQESSLCLHQGVTRTVASRDIELPEGWWIGCGGQGPSDRTLTVLEIRDGQNIRGLLLHANLQSSVLDGTGAVNGKCVSPDLAGIACAELEQRYPGAVAMFMIGAAGDQAPAERAIGYVPDENGGYTQTDLHEAGIAMAERLGHILAEEAEKTLRADSIPLEMPLQLRARTFMAPAKKMNRNLHELRPTRACTWEPDGEKSQSIELFTLGHLAIVGVRPELTYPTLMQIRAASPFPVTLVATMVNGGAKYMADESAYMRCMYEAINSPFAPGAAELLVREIAALMQES